MLEEWGLRLSQGQLSLVGAGAEPGNMFFKKRFSKIDSWVYQKPCYIFGTSGGVAVRSSLSRYSVVISFFILFYLFFSQRDCSNQKLYLTKFVLKTKLLRENPHSGPCHLFWIL